MRTEIALLLVLACGTVGATEPPDKDYLDVRERSLCEAPPERPDWCEWPRDVRVFVERYDSCEHFIGEEPYDEERRRYLEEAIAESCTGNDAELRRLRQVHADDAKLRTLLETELEFVE